jgi:hypothetical protein
MTMTKQVNTDDWSIHPEAFGTLQQWFGKFSMDLFASPENFKVTRYYSYAFSADSAGVDAFSMSWEGEKAYSALPIALILRTIRKIEVTKMTKVLLIPLWAYCALPITLILRTIRKIEVTKMTGVLLIPLWRGARFWLHAFPDGRHLGGVFRSFIQLKAKTRSWGTTHKDAFAGKWVLFLALEIDSRGVSGSLESVVLPSRSFGRLFGYDCIC